MLPAKFDNDPQNGARTIIRLDNIIVLLIFDVDITSNNL